MTRQDTITPWPHGTGGMACRIRDHDWAATPLGPIETWPPTLRFAVGMILDSPFPMALLWGPELVTLHNDAYRPLLGAKSEALGLSFLEVWVEAGDIIGPQIRKAQEGEGSRVENARFELWREGRPEEAFFDYAFSPIRDDARQVAGVLNSGVETTERMIAERRALRENAARQQAFAAACSDVVYYMNPDWSEMRGLGGQGFLQDTSRPSRDWMETYIFPDDRPVVQAAIDKAVRDRRLFDLEHRVVRADGSQGWTHSRAAPVLDEQGKVTEWVGFAQDITLRREAEERLRQSEEQYRVLLDSIDEGFCTVEVMFDDNGRCVDYLLLEVNQAFTRQTGIVDAVGRTATELAPDLERHWFDIYGRIATTGQPERFENRADSIGRWYDVYALRVGDPSQRRVALLFRDILPRKRAEMALRESESRLRSVLDGMDEPFGLMDRNFRILAFNRAALQFATAPADQILGRSYWEIEPDSEGSDVGRLLRQAMDEHQAKSLEHPYTTASGQKQWLEIRAFPVPEGLAVFWRDITERKASEERLRESEARLAAAFESVPVGVAVVDLRGSAVIANNHSRWFLPSGYIPSRDPQGVGRWRCQDAEGRPLLPHDFPGARALRGEHVVPGQEMIYTDDTGRDVWTLVSAVPIRDLAGEVTSIALAIIDIDGAKRSSAALRESEERFRTILETVRDYAIFTTDAEGRIETWPSGAEAVFGWAAEEAVGQPVDITFTPEEQASGVPAKERLEAREWGQAPNIRWHQRRDGSQVFIEGIQRPIMGPGGKVTGFLKVGQDVTVRRATEAALRESERRFRSLAEGIPQLVWQAGDYGHWTWASPQWTAFTGQPEEESHGWGWLDRVHPEDRDAARAAWDGARATNTFEADYRVREAATGEYRWFQTRATPVRDEAGRVVEWLGTSTDVQDLRELQERQGVLVAELQHRTRNLLAVVTAVTHKTLEGSASLADFGTRILDRLGALSRVNGLLSRLHEGDRISFDELLRTELLGHGINVDGKGHPQVRLAGPAGLRLRSSMVQTLALGLHELATNALKYGALSQPEGQLAVTWDVAQNNSGEWRLLVDWRESGVPVSQADPLPGEPPALSPFRRGFGRELIESALPYQLKAETTYRLGLQGLHCTIALPLFAELDELSMRNTDHD